MSAIAVPELWLPGRDGVPHIELPKLPTPADVANTILRKLRGGDTPDLKAARDAIMLRMAGFSNAAEIDVLDSVFGDHGSIQLYTAPVFLALTTVAVAETDTGSTLTEATGATGYARISVAAASMGAAAAGAKANSTTLTGAAITAGSAVVIGWAVCTAVTAGGVIVFGTCTSTTISTTQTPPTVNTGALSATLD